MATPSKAPRNLLNREYRINLFKLATARRCAIAHPNSSTSAKLLSGEIKVGSEKGDGSTFKVTFPLKIALTLENIEPKRV